MTTPPKGSRRSSPKSRWPDFVGTWPRLIGRQTPEIECRHPGDESEGDRCATFAFRIGLRCMPWQWLILRAMLSLLDPNQWGERLFTHRNVVIECSRQNGKTLIVIVRILWGLFRRRERILYTAQEWKTAEDVFDRVCAVIDRVPAFQRQLAAKPSKKDNRGVILLVDGTKADFGPRSLNFGRGLTEVDLLIMDEAYDVVPKHSANLTGTQRAAQNPQTIWLSTPPVAAEHPHCHKLAGFHRLGKAGAKNPQRALRLYYALFAAPDGMARTDPKAYPLAHPSLGVVGSVEEVQDALQSSQTAADIALFDADYLGRGQYPPPETTVVSEIDARKWADMAKGATPQLTGETVLVIERTLDRKQWLLFGGRATTTGRTHIEVGYGGACTVDEFVLKVVAAVEAMDPNTVAVRGGSDGSELESKLIKAGVEPTPITKVEVAAFCGGFLDAVGEQQVSHRDQPELNRAMRHAVKHRRTGGGFVWEPIDDTTWAYLMGASMTHGVLAKYANHKTPVPPPPLAEAPDPTDSSADSAVGLDDDFDALTAAF